MKTIHNSLPGKFARILFMIVLIAIPVWTATAANLQQDEPTPTDPTTLDTEEPTTPPPPTQTPTQTEPPPPTQTEVPTPTIYLRPLVVVDSYASSVSEITPGKEFNLELKLTNKGRSEATNLVATFTSGDFVPRQTGGVVAVGDLVPGDDRRINQPLIAMADLSGKTIATLVVTINYTDTYGTPYQETFTLTFPVARPKAVGPVATVTPTPTATPGLRPQLVITSYDTGSQPLKPGGSFILQMNIQNVGNAEAKRVTMIVGGGSSSTGPSSTPSEPGGISGSGGDLSNFAPLGSSNIQSLGNLDIGKAITAQQNLIVNVSTNPGAYPLKISFVYIDENNNPYVDDQVITLLVYSPPQLEIGFYRELGPIFAGQPNGLPLQVVNLGRKVAILGNFKASAEGAELMNNTTFIGMLESGGYFPLDAMIIPFGPGPMELVVSVSYTDDFNQPQEITKNFAIDVLDSPGMEPGYEGPDGEGPVGPDGPGNPGGNPETFWQKLVRFVKGLIGLDSGQSTSQGTEGGPPPGYEGPIYDGPSPKGP